MASGQIVVLPTECGYFSAVSGLSPAAIGRLDTAASGKQPGSHIWAIALRGASEALDWSPDLSPVGQRLMRRAWPGPLMVAGGHDAEQGMASRLPEVVRSRVCPDGSLFLWAPAHRAVQAILRRFEAPLVLHPITTAEAPVAVTAEEAVHILTEPAALVLDDGPSRFGQPATVVRANGQGVTVIRTGVLTPAQVEQLSATVLLFICTGNTCRSPLAEALCKKQLADRLGCTPNELPQRGFLVLSAGLAAMMGGEAAPAAVAVAQEYGADLSRHQSRPLSVSLLAQADTVFVMTRGHLRSLSSQFPKIGPEPRLLSPTGLDLADPVGADEPVYRDCARQIWSDLEQQLAEFQRT